MFKNKPVLVVLLAAMNLRLAVTAVTPLFAMIQRSLGTSAAAMALLITIPLLCFAGGALVTPALLRRVGLKVSLLLASASLLMGNLVRPVNAVWLFIGTMLIGAGIAVLNILIPAMIAQFPAQQTTRLTSYYAVTMNVIAALGTALAIPLAQLWGWAVVLRSFALPVVLVMIVGSTLPEPSISETRSPRANVNWHDRQLWLLTAFMGGQSIVYYTLATWLPTIFQALGASVTLAGNLAAVFQLSGIPAALVLNRLSHPRQGFTWICLGCISGVVALTWPGYGWWLGALILGFTGSLLFSTALNLVAISATDPQLITQRAAISQSFGYLLAAGGPVVFGQLARQFGSWWLVLGVLLLLVGVTLSVGRRLTRS